MCGIFGYTVRKGAPVKAKELRVLLASLVSYSESRGKEAAGLALRGGDRTIQVYKAAKSGSALLRERVCKNLVEQVVSDEHIAQFPLAVMGHTRLVTNGSLERHENNQPVIRDGIVGIHNGIIVNDSEIFERFGLTPTVQVDTESLLALINLFTQKGQSVPDAVSSAFKEVYGTASVALLFRDAPILVLASNNGSLYYAQSDFGYVFASEEYILKHISQGEIHHIAPLTGLVINLDNGHAEPFHLDQPSANGIHRGSTAGAINDIHSEHVPSVAFKNIPSPAALATYERAFDACTEEIMHLRRCNRCILPETMPFITFDTQGVCNYCHHHVDHVLKNKDELFQNADRIRRTDGRPDCIIPLSGGRDSSFGLHYAKTVLNLNPVAFSYDWGMLTDLGRRNQARMCGKLGVEHILVSADIGKKRSNIRKNVTAWLNKPDLGTVPLFMAGDKQYFYYLNRLRKQMGIDFALYSENPLEQTNFKYGFCGVAPKFDTQHVYRLGLYKKLALAFYYAKSFITNPGYLNSSLLDTLGAYGATYFLPHHYDFLYDYIPWSETEIDHVLIDDYAWETAPDTPTTWRIGDGTAALYNYIYYIGAGFTENDTFRSNQIRAGQISRDKALELVSRENQPRFDAIRWYCDTIGIDFSKTVETINAMPRRYFWQI